MRRFWVWALCASLLAGLWGCAGHPNQIAERLAARSFGSALEDIETFYYRETKASELVQAGLAAIHERYPLVDFSREDDRIVASMNGKPLHSIAIQNDEGTAHEWADQVTPVLVQVKEMLPPEDSPELADLTDTFLDGMVDRLDAFSGYVSPREVLAQRQRSQGSPGTVNIRVKPEDRGIRIIQIYNAPALGSGLLRRGDLIVKIDGVPTTGIVESTFHDLVRGPVGSPIVLTILRSDASVSLAVTLQRERDDENSVAVFREGSIQRIVVTRFYGRTVSDLRDLLNDLKNDLQPAKGVILDLRNNPGGLLDSVISVSDFFLGQGRILTTHGRHSESHQNFTALSDALMVDEPLVVLIDENSAAGSEIVAAALQDNDRAVVVGSSSWGRGSIATLLPLENGGTLGLTWTEAHTPAGYRLDKRGVMPTVCTGGKVTAEEVLHALHSGGGVVDHATRIRDIDPEDTDAVAAFRALCPPREDGAEDVALKVAKAILADPALYARLLSSGQ